MRKRCETLTVVCVETCLLHSETQKARREREVSARHPLQPALRGLVVDKHKPLTAHTPWHPSEQISGCACVTQSASPLRSCMRARDARARASLPKWQLARGSVIVCVIIADARSLTAHAPDPWRTAAAHMQQLLCGEASRNLHLKFPSDRCRSASEEDAKRRGLSILELDHHTISAVRLNPNNPDDHLHGDKVSLPSSLCSSECMRISTGTAACALHVADVQGLRSGALSSRQPGSETRSRVLHRVCESWHMHCLLAAAVLPSVRHSNTLYSPDHGKGGAALLSMAAAHVRVHTHSLTKTAMGILKRPRFWRLGV